MDKRIREMKAGLDEQMRLREEQAKKEIRDNHEYMKAVLARNAQENSKQEEMIKRRKDRIRENQKIVKDQIEDKQKSPI